MDQSSSVYSKLGVSVDHLQPSQTAKKTTTSFWRILGSFLLCLSLAFLALSLCFFLMPSRFLSHHKPPSQEIAVARSRSSHHEKGTFLNAHSIQVACNTTMYPQLCFHTLISYPGARSASPPQLVAIIATVALEDVNQTYFAAKNLSSEKGSDMEMAALSDCLELMDDSRDQLNLSISRLSKLHLDSTTFLDELADVQTWLSASLTDQDTCSDGFEYADGDIKDQMLKREEPISQMLSIALALAARLHHTANHSFSSTFSQNRGSSAPAVAP